MWADHVVLDVNRRLVGIETDTAATADVVRRALGALVAVGVEAIDVPAAFGVRAGGRRTMKRELALLYHGSRVIHRGRSLDGTLDALRRILATLDLTAGDGEVITSLRVFARGDRAVLVDVAPPRLSGDRRLLQQGIVELPTWRALVDVTTATVVADRPLRLAGIVSEDASGGREALLQRLWMLGDGPARSEWADLLERLSQERRVSAARGATPREAIEKLFRSM